MHFGGAFAFVVKSNVTRSAQRPPVAATARNSAELGALAVRIGSVVPTPWHATVVGVTTAAVVEVVEAGTLVAVVVVVGGASVVVSDVAAGLSELLHAAASGNSAKATNR